MTQAVQWIPRNQVPKTAKISPVKLNMKIKRDKDNNIIECKTRCNVRGDLQKPNMRYDPARITTNVADRGTIRAALSTAAVNNCHAEHIDIKSAFLHEKSDPSITLCMRQPPRFNGMQKCPNAVGKVAGNLCGTKQACRIFMEGLEQHLQNAGFRKHDTDASAHTKREGTNFITLLIAIDDMLIIFNSSSLMQTTK